MTDQVLHNYYSAVNNKSCDTLGALYYCKYLSHAMELYNYYSAVKNPVIY